MKTEAQKAAHKIANDKYRAKLKAAKAAQVAAVNKFHDTKGTPVANPAPTPAALALAARVDGALNIVAEAKAAKPTEREDVRPGGVTVFVAGVDAAAGPAMTPAQKEAALAILLPRLETLRNDPVRHAATEAGLQVRARIVATEGKIKAAGGKVPAAAKPATAAKATRTPAAPKAKAAPVTLSQVGTGKAALAALLTPPAGTKASRVAEVIKDGDTLVLVKASDHTVRHAPRAIKPGVLEKLVAYSKKRDLFVTNIVGNSTVVIDGALLEVPAK